MKKTVKADAYFEVSALRGDEESVNKVKEVFDQAVRVVLEKRANGHRRRRRCIIL